MIAAIVRWIAYHRFRASLTHGERVRLDYWGATGNPTHTQSRGAVAKNGASCLS